MSETEDKDLSSDSFDSCDSPIPLPIERELGNRRKRPKQSSSSGSPSPTVQNPRALKLQRTSTAIDSCKMDDATKTFFKNIILESEERTQNVIKSEVTSVKDELVTTINLLEVKVQHLQSELDNMHSNLRKKNIIIQGIPEKKDESWKELENADFYLKLGITDKPDYDDCFRLGKRTTGKPRPILLKLIRQRDKTNIMSRRKQLKGTSIFANDDNPKEVRKQLSLLRLKEKQLRQQYPDARIWTRNQILIFTRGDITKRYIVNQRDEIVEKPEYHTTHEMQY
jgi:hypothetical protein